MADLSKIPSYNKTFSRVGKRVDKYRKQQMLLSALSALPQLGFAFANYRRQGQWHDDEMARQQDAVTREQARYDAETQRQDRIRNEDYMRSTIPVPESMMGDVPMEQGPTMGGAPVQTRMTPQMAYYLSRMKSGGDAGNAYDEETHDRLMAAELRNGIDSIQRKYGPDVPFKDFSPEDQSEYDFLSSNLSTVRKRMVKRFGVDSPNPNPSPSPSPTPGQPQPGGPPSDDEINKSIDDAMNWTETLPYHPLQSGFQRMLQPSPVDLFDTNAARGAGIVREPTSMPVNPNDEMLNAILGKRDPNRNPFTFDGK